jgi:hypothetical protein
MCACCLSVIRRKSAAKILKKAERENTFGFFCVSAQ